MAIKLTNYKPSPPKHKLEAGIEQLALEHLRSVVKLESARLIVQDLWATRISKPSSRKFQYSSGRVVLSCLGS